MFTGLIETVGEIANHTPAGAGFRLSVTTELAGSLKPGDSVSVNGVCLTMVVTRFGYRPGGRRTRNRARDDAWWAQARGSGQLGEAPARDSRWEGLRAGPCRCDRISGADTAEADCRRLTISFPPQLASYIVRKGSIAVDGSV